MRREMRLLLYLLLMAVSTVAHAETWLGAARVVDGDTLVIGATRLRLLSVDAPEGAQTCRDSQQQEYDCGREATRELERLIGGREVICSGEKRDRYGRALVVCSVGGVNLNAELVRSGWAVTYLGRDFEREEAEARKAQRGLWVGEFQRPEDWRRQRAR